MSVSISGFRSAEREDLLAKDLSVVERPKGIGEPNILFGADHSGDAAVHIIYPVSTRIKPMKKRISILAAYSEAIYDQLRTLDLDVIPYVRFRETDG